MDDLTKTDRKNLARLEGLIREGLSTFCAVGRALCEIREERLYRDHYETFEQYCVERWEFTRQRAQQLITASDEVERLSTIVDTPPTREGHVRPLLVVPADHRAEVWREAVTSSPRDGDGRPIVTARIVQEAVDRWHAKRTVDGARAPAPAPEPAEVRYDPGPDLEGSICPECGSTETAEDEDGRYCARCKATIRPPEPDDDATYQEPAEPDTDPELSPDDALLAALDSMVRRQFAGRLTVAAARVEMLVDRWRAEA